MLFSWAERASSRPINYFKALTSASNCARSDLSCGVTGWHRQRAVAWRARHEHAGDAGPAAGNAVRLGDGVEVEAQVAAKLLQQRRAGAIGHRLRHVVADAVREQPVAPEHLHIGRLVGKVRLVR